MVLDLSCIPAVVLIVEDEMILRMFAVDMVEDAGYTPVEAVDADEAIALLESRSDIALMCTDVRMPGGMDGLELARTVNERWPSIKIIVVSGQLSPSSVDLPPCSRFFGKPLQAGQMIAQMQSMIGHA
jgi:CheY-like chemotaxis protein